MTRLQLLLTIIVLMLEEVHFAPDNDLAHCPHAQRPVHVWNTRPLAKHTHAFEVHARAANGGCFAWTAFALLAMALRNQHWLRLIWEGRPICTTVRLNSAMRAHSGQ